MPQIGDPMYQVDHRYAPGLKRKDEEMIFRTLSLDVGDPLSYHYIDKPGSRFGMPILCLESVGSTLAECEKMPVPGGGFLHTAQKNEKGQTAFPRRKIRLLIWNYAYDNEATQTKGRAQILPLGGFSKGEVAYITSCQNSPSQGDVRTYDMRRACTNETTRECGIDVPRTQRQSTVVPPAKDAESEQTCLKFFVEFLTELHKQNPFLTKETMQVHVSQWKALWQIIHTPPATVDDVKRDLERLAEAHQKAGTAQAKEEPAGTFGFGDGGSGGPTDDSTPVDWGELDPAELDPAATEAGTPKAEAVEDILSGLDLGETAVL